MNRGPETLEAARTYEQQLVRFLRDMIAIPAESCKEGERCERVLREYEALGFDEAYFDGLGSVVGRIGTGPFKILFDGHIDCVGVGDVGAWAFDPFAGKHENGEVWGRGAVDELPAIAGMAYGAKILKDRGVPDGVSLYLTASVMEEDCDGYCMRHLIETEGHQARRRGARRTHRSRGLPRPTRPHGGHHHHPRRLRPRRARRTAASTRCTRWRRS